MDSMRDFIEQADGLGPVPAVDSDATPPPMIGQDERRMHVRAYNFWANLIGTRSFPSIDDLDLDNIGDFGAHAVLLDFTSGIENPAIGYVGDAIASECDLDPETGYIADVPRRSLLSRLTDHYLQIIANRAPIGFEAEFENARGLTIMYRGVLLPFSSDDDTIDFILGVINWKEAADSALNDAIAAEVAAAAAVQPLARRAEAMMPLWADGPDTAPPAELAQPGFVSFADAVKRAESAGDGETRDEVIGSLGEAPVTDTAGFDDELLLLESVPSSLADWLAIARECAGEALQSEARGHKALYEAIGRAHDFARAVAEAPGDFAELIDEAGLKVSARAPMTAVVKLVFGAAYDKTRLAEITLVLRHAAREGLDREGLIKRLSHHAGGLKGLVKAERASQRPAQSERLDKAAMVRQHLRNAAPLARIVGMTAGDEEFAVVVLRRDADGLMSVVAQLDAPTGNGVIDRLGQ